MILYPSISFLTQNSKVSILNNHFWKRCSGSTRVSSFSTKRQQSTTTPTSNTTPQIILEQMYKPQELPGAEISLLTMNRPKANAMGSVMLSELKDAIEVLEDSTTRCVVLTSCSNKVFSAGADLKERATMTMNQAAAFVTDLRMTFERLSALPIPIIAAIEGVAVGGGLEIALAADIRIASETATLGLPETSLAIVPGAGGTQRLPRLIGTARAKELIFTATRLDGYTAEQYGLVQHVVPSGEATNYAIDMAWKIAKNGPVAIHAAKYAIDEGMTIAHVSEALIVEREAYERVLTTRDRLEGIAAFNEKRTPEYRGH